MIIDDLKTAVNGLIPEDWIDDIYFRLESLGYEVKEIDLYPLTYNIKKQRQYICNECNISTVPDDLHYCYVDLVVGAFLHFRFVNNSLNISDIDLSNAVTSIHIGDASVTYSDGGNDKQKFLSMIEQMTSGCRGEILCYRKIRW